MLVPLLNKMLDSPLPAELTRYELENKICHGKLVGSCFRGDEGSNGVPILVLGDSHAAQLNYFFDVVGQASHQLFRVVTASSCVTIPGFDVGRLPEWARADCLSQIEATSYFINQGNTIVVAGMWQYHVARPTFLRAFEDFLTKADVAGKKVIVLAQIPMLTTNVQRLRRFEFLGFPVKTSYHPDWLGANKIVENLVLKSVSACYLNLSKEELFYDAPFNNGTMIYLDNHHLNELGSKLYGKIAIKFFNSI